MSEDLDENLLLEDYIEGQLSEADAERLTALLEKSDALKERLALTTVVDRLLRASRLKPVSGGRVLKALRQGGHVPVRTPKRRMPVFGVMVAVLFLALLVGGVLVLLRPADLDRSRTADSKPGQPYPGAGGPPPVTSGAGGPPPVAATHAPAFHLMTTDSTADVEELPDSAFLDDSPPPVGDGSDEPGFVPPPPTRMDTLRPVGEGRKGGARGQGAMEPTQPREAPKGVVVFVNLNLGDSQHGRSSLGDLEVLLRELQFKAGLAYCLETRLPDEVSDDAERNPVLYVSGHYHFTFTPEQRKTFRKFMLAGGTMVFDSGLGSKPFYDSARRELGIIFRDVPLKALSPDHPLFSSFYDLSPSKSERLSGALPQGRAKRPAEPQVPGGGQPVLEGITVRCRCVALVSRWGLVAGDRSGEELRLGVNVASYVIAWRGWVKPGRMPGIEVQESKQGYFDRLRIGQVIIDGGWQPRPFALPMLLQSFSRKTAVPIQSAIREVRLTDPGLFDLPFLYLSGHEGFRLTNAELNALSRYLESGGFLLAEACCGQAGFDQAFRSELRRALPGASLAPISPADSLFAEPNQIKRMSVTPLLAGRLGRSVIEPRLEGVKLNGHYAVVYTPYGMAGCWEMSQNPYALGYNDTEAIRLGQNILMYAVTH